MYVAARGGEGAIQNAEQLYHELKAPLTLEAVREIERTMPYLIDRVMGEGSLYAPDLAALALAQCGGDIYEAVLMLRAYRSTQPRIGYALPVSGDDMLTVRRISAAFKDIPGGQVLGPSLDYSHRILRLDVLDGSASSEEAGAVPEAEPLPERLPSVAGWQRAQNLLPEIDNAADAEMEAIADVTREPLLFPAPRAVRLQSLSRAETGGVLALGYANMRGYGSVHPTINELRLGYADVQIKHPITGEPFTIGRVRISQAEVVTTFKGSASDPKLKLGFCATIGWNEVKTIAGSMLDMAMDLPEPHPSHTEEYVLYHTDPVESSGFCIHYKLPHYVTFGSSLDAMRAVKMMAPARAAKNGYYGDGEELSAATPGVHAEKAAPVTMSEFGQAGQAEQAEQAGQAEQAEQEGAQSK
ncbi:MAG: carbon-phosphorus lyase complex subunit PhnI [Chloroflexi bacterium]|nr:carbon-phosphorus lyase complex subunit PhnI [Chloroflexota bacterium]